MRGARSSADVALEGDPRPRGVPVEPGTRPVDSVRSRPGERLHSAVGAFRRGVELTAVDHPDAKLYRSNLAQALRQCGDVTESGEDVDRAIAGLREIAN